MREVPPVVLYSAALRTAAAGGTAAGWRVRSLDGAVRPLDLARWCAPGFPGDDPLLARCGGPTLDIGCGPGRLAAALCARGIPTLGLDIAAAAVQLAAAAGVPVLHGSVFGRVPRSGSWAHALLVDGNLGIGGNPVRLLRRVGKLLAPGGSLLCELDPPGTPAGPVRLRIESPGGRVSAWFAWAQVAPRDLPALAAAGGLGSGEVWRADGRWFAEVRAA